MAGLRTSVLVCATSFLLGLLFTHWIADSLTLWKSPETQTDPRLWTSATYYTILSRMPPTLAQIYAAVVVLGGTTLLWSLGDGRAGNLMFDGGSALLYASAVVLYIYSVLPSLFANFATLPLPFAAQDAALSSQTPPPLPPFPPTLRGPILELASSHLVCSVALTGVLALQAGRWWAEQSDIDDDDEEEVAGGDADEAAAETEVNNKNRTQTAEVSPVDTRSS